MRILFAITRGEIGGAQAHVRILAEGLALRGHEIALAIETPSTLAAQVQRSQIRILPWTRIRRELDPVADLGARRELRRHIRDFRPDILHLHSSKAGVLGRGLLRRPAGITLFTCHHAPYGPGRQLVHRLLTRPLDQLTLPGLDGIISVGARDLPLLRKISRGVPTALVRNAVPTAEPPISAPAGTLAALWVARLQRPKDPIQAVRAWEHVTRRVPSARLIMCGSGPLQSELESRIAKSPAKDNIEYLGRVEDLRTQYERAALFVLATRVEGGTTIATLEAMANGLVPVMSDAGDSFLLEHSGAGVTVAPRSHRALADAVVQLLVDPHRVQEMRTAALKFAREDWLVDDMVTETEAFYRRTLKE